MTALKENRVYTETPVVYQSNTLSCILLNTLVCIPTWAGLAVTRPLVMARRRRGVCMRLRAPESYNSRLQVNDYPIKVLIHRYTMKTHLRWLQTVFVRQYM